MGAIGAGGPSRAPKRESNPRVRATRVSVAIRMCTGAGNRDKRTGGPGEYQPDDVDASPAHGALALLVRRS